MQTVGIEPRTKFFYVSGEPCSECIHGVICDRRTVQLQQRVFEIVRLVNNDDAVLQVNAECGTSLRVKERLIRHKYDLSEWYTLSAGIIRARVEFATQADHLFDVLGFRYEGITE